MPKKPHPMESIFGQRGIISIKEFNRLKEESELQRNEIAALKARIRDLEKIILERKPPNV